MFCCTPETYQRQSLSWPWQPAGQHLSPSMHIWICDCGFAQTPLLQLVPPVQPFLSSHIMPLFAGMPPTHVPLLHVSPAVQSLPSSQPLPSLPGMATQVCCPSLHTAILHGSFGAPHMLGMPLHTPDTH